jgi:precorrin-2 dehydrogenase / sirohydrochlorin ferrochelatase
MRRRNSPISHAPESPSGNRRNNAEKKKSRGKDMPVGVVYFPAFLNLTQKKAVVIGGGRIAERKILGLIEAGAAVTVISPEITKKIEKEKTRERVVHIQRKYRKGDLQGAFLVIAATDAAEVNRRIAAEAECLLNIVDTPEFCNFIVPSSMRRGPLTVAVSTGGVSPAFSRTVRKEIEKVFGKETGAYLEFVARLRAETLRTLPEGRKRSDLLKKIGSAEMLECLREKGPEETAGKASALYRNACSTIPASKSSPRR